MEQRLRIEKVQNGIIFTNDKSERWVEIEPKSTIDEIIGRIMKEVEAAGDVVIIIASPDKSDSCPKSSF